MVIFLQSTLQEMGRKKHKKAERGKYANQKKKNHALRSLQLICFTFEHEPCVNTQRILIKPACADKYFFHSPFLSPHYTCLTLKLCFFCTFPPTTTPPAEPQTPQQKRERPGRGRQRLWSDKQFLFFYFSRHLQTWALAALCPRNHFPKEQLFVLVF